MAFDWLTHRWHDRRRIVKTRIWDVEARPDFFPERDETEGLGVPWFKDKADLGIAFSGGGTRSASATLGQLRGLRTTGLLDKVKYISAVSGGSWAATPYTYLPSNYDEDLFLGVAKPPEALTGHDLQSAPEASLAHAISESVIADDVLKNAVGLAGDEAYARAVGALFLQPFGLDDRAKFFSFHDMAVRSVVEGNSESDDRHYYLVPEDFYTVREGRPYLIVGGTILRVGNTGASRQEMQCEYTPLYCGVRRLFPSAGRGGAPIGGGYVETFAYDSEAPSGQWDGRRWRVKLGRERYRFTLSDMIGSSGAAPQELLEELSLHHLGFPEFRHWPVHRIGALREEEYAHGDGGHLENLGIMPLLARGVRHIVVFSNTKVPFDRSTGRMSSSFAPLFRSVQSKKESDAQFVANVVLEDSGKFDALVTGLAQRKDAGRPLIHCDTYDVRANPHYKIAGGYKVKICWVHNDAVAGWFGGLDDEARGIVDGLERFPHYKTFFQSPPKIIDLSVEEVNALAHLSSWVVEESANEIRTHFGL